MIRLVGTFRRFDDPDDHMLAFVKEPSMDDQKPNVTPQYCSIPHIAKLNLARCLRWHPGGVNSWSLSDWGVAFAGEVGELCNVVKKLNRVRDGLVGNKESAADLTGALRKEIADCYLYLDLLAQAAGVDLATAVRDKFNEVSERNGFPERL